MNTKKTVLPNPMAQKLEKMIACVERDITAGRVSKKFTNARDFLADLKQRKRGQLKGNICIENDVDVLPKSFTKHFTQKT